MFWFFFCGENCRLVAIIIDTDKPHICKSLELLPEVLILFLSPAVHLVCMSPHGGQENSWRAESFSEVGPYSLDIISLNSLSSGPCT